MAIFSLAQRTTNAAATSDCLEIIAGANNAYRLLELGFTLNAATATTLGYGTPAAIGVTPVGVTALAEDSGNTTAGNTQGSLSWGTQPTIPANFFRRVSLPATIGAGIIWTFPRGISVLKAKSTTVWNFVAGSVMDVWFVVDE